MSLVLNGRIVKKRKRSEWIVLTLIDEGDDNHLAASDKSAETAGSSSSSLGRTVYVPRRPPSSTIKGASNSSSFPAYLFYLNAIICVHGDMVASLDSTIVTPTNRTLLHPKSEESPVANTESESFIVARTIDLLQCAPDPQAVQTVVEAFLNNDHRDSDYHSLLSALLPYSLTKGCVAPRESPNAAVLDNDNGLRYLHAKNQMKKLIESMQRIGISDFVEEIRDGESNDASKVEDDGTCLTTTERRPSPSTVYATIVYNLLHGINVEGNNLYVSDRASTIVEPQPLKRRAPRNRVRHIPTSDLEVLQQAEASMLLGSSKTRSPILLVKSTVAVSVDHSVTELDQDRACPDMQDSSNHEVTATSSDAFESDVMADCSTLPLMSSRGHQSRYDYLVAKKLPQVSWMVDRIAAIIASTARRGRPFAHILDVGGGRGDLALALAQRFATTKVTVVDRNATSVAAGQARAEAWNPAACRDGQIRFIVADFEAYATSSLESSAGKGPDDAALTPVDLVVALHACGDLSDAALYHATHTLQGCSFLICPCCYTKRYLTKSFWEPTLTRNGSFVATMDTTEPVHAADANPNSMDSIRNPLSSWDAPTISTLLRLAELNEHPNVRHRAATLINTARLQRSVDTVQLCHAINESDDVQQRPTCKTNNSYSTLQLEEFSNSYSTRNLVLVGIAFNPPGRSTEKSTS